MKYMKQFTIILAVTCVGELLRYFLPLPVPGSIYGLLLMLLLLITGVVKVQYVKDTAEFLIEIMPMMFIPAGVGLLNAWGQLSTILLPITIITLVSTVFVMGVTGMVAETVMKLRKRQTSKADIAANTEEAEKRQKDNELGCVVNE